MQRIKNSLVKLAWVCCSWTRDNWLFISPLTGKEGHSAESCLGLSTFFTFILIGIDQYDRDSIINDFKNGACRLMVATSVAARGLDVKQLILVVNYSCPNHYEDYVHRAGRTGRAGNKVSYWNWICVVLNGVLVLICNSMGMFVHEFQGYAYTFITEDQVRYAGDIIKALELSGSPVPPELEQLWASFKDQQKAVSWGESKLPSVFRAAWCII